MGRVVRLLLTRGNGKLGEGIHSWSLPAVSTCPGASSVCKAECYATKSRFLLPAVQERLAWNLEQTRRDDFVARLTAEIGRKGCQVVRVHVSGDYFSRKYAEKWLAVMRAKPKPRYFFYSRSWRSPEIAPVLEQMAQLRQCRVWYSIDKEAGVPDPIPPGVRLAYLQVGEGERPELLDLRFAVRRLRSPRLDLPLLCPNEQGRADSCGDCGRCFR